MKLPVMIWSLLFLQSWTTALPLGVLPIHEESVATCLYLPATLPCVFPFVKSLTDLTVMWIKVKNQREIIIYKLLYGVESPEEQDQRYKGRVQLSKKFSQGNLELTITNVTYDDEGTYYCRAANHQGHGDKKVTLSIDKLDAVDPTVTLVTVDGKRYMKCRGSGVFGVPEIQWIIAQGEDLSSYGKHNITERTDGLKVVESTLHYDVKKNVQVLCHIKEGRLKRSTRAIISDGTSSVVVENDFSQSRNKEQKTSDTESSKKLSSEWDYGERPVAEYARGDSGGLLSHRVDGTLIQLLVVFTCMLVAQ